MGRIELSVYTPHYVPTGTEIAVIETSKGTVRVELFGREVPVTVGNFVELAAKDFYDNLKFHAKKPGSVVLGGCPTTRSMGPAQVLAAAQGVIVGNLGTELAARLLKYKLRNLSIGRLCLSIDVTVICLYAFTFRSVNNALYGIVAMYISSLTMDTVVYGSINAKIAYIISGHSGEVAKRLLGLDLGITLLDGRGGYSGDRKQVVLCAFKRSQFAVVKATVTAIDPNAFIIVCEAHEVLGEGFGAYTPDSL